MNYFSFSHKCACVLFPNSSRVCIFLISVKTPIRHYNFFSSKRRVKKKAFLSFREHQFFELKMQRKLHLSHVSLQLFFFIRFTSTYEKCKQALLLLLVFSFLFLSFSLCFDQPFYSRELFLNAKLLSSSFHTTKSLNYQLLLTKKIYIYIYIFVLKLQSVHS